MLWLKLLKFVTIHSWHVWICNVESVFAFQCGAHGTAVLFFVYIILVVGFKNTHFFLLHCFSVILAYMEHFWACALLCTVKFLQHFCLASKCC